MDGAWQLVVALAAALAMCPAAFFWECWPCCDKGCEVVDGKPRTDPKTEGTWVPSGTWRGAGGVTWTFTANPGDESGETWFFYGSAGTSRPGGSATAAEQEDWGNICNWYSSKTTAPDDTTNIPADLDKRAVRLPPTDAVVHIYSSVATSLSGPVTVKNIYVWRLFLLSGSEVTATASAHDSAGGSVFAQTGSNAGTVNGGATFNFGSINALGAIVNGPVTLNDGTGGISDSNEGTINGNVEFYNGADNSGTINGNAELFDSSDNAGVITGNAFFNDSSNNFGDVDGSAVFNDSSLNFIGTVDGGATFNNNASNGGLGGTVNNGAVFNDTATNGGTSLVFSPGTVNGGATFNDNSVNKSGGTVNGGAFFNDAACSERFVGNFSATPCTRQFVTHPSDVPTCNGTAPDGCANAADTCGCG